MFLTFVLTGCWFSSLLSPCVYFWPVAEHNIWEVNIYMDTIGTTVELFPFIGLYWLWWSIWCIFQIRITLSQIQDLKFFVLHKNFELGYNSAWVTFTLKLLPFDLPHLREKRSSFIHPFGCNMDFDIFLVLEVHINKFLISEEDNYPQGKTGTHTCLHVGFLFY